MRRSLLSDRVGEILGRSGGKNSIKLLESDRVRIKLTKIRKLNSLSALYKNGSKV